MAHLLSDFLDLTDDQRETLEALERDSELCRTFYFIGGTLLKAVGIVPRVSNDLDFFTFNTIDGRTYLRERQRFHGMLTEIFGNAIEETQQGFMHRSSGMIIDIVADAIQNIGSFVPYGNLKAASSEDNAANKASALCSRDEVKDLIDIAFLTKAKEWNLVDLERIAEKKFGLGTVTEEKLVTELLAKQEQFEIPLDIFLRNPAENKNLVERQVALLIESSTL